MVIVLMDGHVVLAKLISASAKKKKVLSFSLRDGSSSGSAIFFGVFLGPA